MAPELNDHQVEKVELCFHHQQHHLHPVELEDLFLRLLPFCECEIKYVQSKWKLVRKTTQISRKTHQTLSRRITQFIVFRSI